MNNGKEPIFISAVIYVRNNAATIGSFLQHVYGQLEKQFAQFEIICVDDASTDLSEQKIREAAKDFTCPVILRSAILSTNLIMRSRPGRMI